MNYENISLALQLIPKELFNTIYMVFFATLFSFLFGLPLGVALYLSKSGGLKENKAFYQTFGMVVNMGRSIPFAILMIAIIPFTRAVAGTSLGTTASIVPLTIAGIPFMARLVEMAMSEIDTQLIEAAIVMDSKISQIIKNVLIPESYPALVRGVTLTAVSLIGYSAMAGLVGGGGLGKIAIQYGYQRFNGFLMIVTLVFLLLLVELTQWGGNKWATHILKKRGKR